MLTKIKILFISCIFLFITFILFSVFYKFQTFYSGYIFELNNYQVIQIKKDQSMNFYENKKIHIKTEQSDFYTYVNSIDIYNNFYYLRISNYLHEIESSNKIWIYSKSISLGEYVLKQIF